LTGYYNDGEGDQYVSGRFECNGEEGELDTAVGDVTNLAAVDPHDPAPDRSVLALHIDAASKPDGTNPSGNVQLVVNHVVTEPLPWATVVCLNVAGDTFGATAMVIRAPSVFEQSKFPDAMYTLIGEYIYIGGTHSGVLDQDPGIVQTRVSDADTCAPNSYPVVNNLSSFPEVHDAP
jgi:hypothetical protein